VTLDATGDVEATVRRLTAAVAAHTAAGDQVVRCAGISLGAHATALWAARTAAPTDLVLVMPAWTGAPDAVAAATLASAADVAAHGSRAVLDRLRQDPALAHDWVLEELERGWSTYDDAALVSALTAAGSSRAPTADELAVVRGRAAVVALADDPLHPEDVARAWAAALPDAALRVVDRQAPATDRGALGRAAVGVLEGLSGSR
jgi:hypothetical protein